MDGEVNPKLQSIHVQDFPISTAHFTRDGTEVVMAGERKSYYVYDMIAGKITRVYGIRGWFMWHAVSMGLEVGSLLVWD